MSQYHKNPVAVSRLSPEQYLAPQCEVGLRYCINSASLRFIPLDKIESEGYGVYRKLFDTQEKE